MPSLFPALPFLIRNQKSPFVKLLELTRTNGADLVISSASVAAGIDDRMNMQLGGFWFAGKLAKALGQFFLKAVIQTVLGAEKDDTALGDWLVTYQ